MRSGPRPDPLDLGADDYYAIEVMFPLNWREPSSEFWGRSLAQFNYQLIWGSPSVCRATSFAAAESCL